MYASNYFENLMLNLMRGQAISAPANLYLGLFLSNPTDDGASGTEISYSGYARQPITFSAPAASGSGMMIQNTAEITFPESQIAAGSVLYVGVFDSLSGGNMWLYGALDTPLVVNAGVSPKFRANSVKWTWTGNLTTFYKTAIMNTLRGTSLNGFTPYIGFGNGDPTDTGNEFSGNNYARVQASMSAPVQQSTGAAMSQNSADLETNIASGNWGTFDTVTIFDASSSGNAYAVLTLASSYNILSNFNISIDAGTLQVSIN